MVPIKPLEGLKTLLYELFKQEPRQSSIKKRGTLTGGESVGLNSEAGVGLHLLYTNVLDANSSFPS